MTCPFHLVLLASHCNASTFEEFVPLCCVERSMERLCGTIALQPFHSWNGKWNGSYPQRVMLIGATAAYAMGTCPYDEFDVPYLYCQRWWRTSPPTLVLARAGAIGQPTATSE